MRTPIDPAATREPCGRKLHGAESYQGHDRARIASLCRTRYAEVAEGGLFARLERADWLLIGTLVPLCAVIFGLHVRSVVTSGMPRLPVLASAPSGPDDYPLAVLH